jgi:hypothetical protein
MQKINPLNRFAFLVIAVLLLSIIPNTRALAALRYCRTDPIFALSNGDKLTVTLDISTDEASIKSVTYILHVPAGVSVKSVVYTAGGLSAKETYKVFQDAAASSYSTDTLVMISGTTKVAVTATTRLNGTGDVVISGYSGQHLVAQIIKR